jgi:transcriptional regulator with XRE-family HTH domain
MRLIVGAMENFNGILKELMVEHGLNQLQLARLLGMKQSQIHNWLYSKSLPGYHSLKMLATKLDVTADELLGLK